MCYKHLNISNFKYKAILFKTLRINTFFDFSISMSITKRCVLHSPLQLYSEKAFISVALNLN